MKKLVLAFSVVVTFSVSGCSLFQSGGDLDRASVERVEKNFDRIAPKYLWYVGNNPNLTADEKDDEKKFVEATERLIDVMKNRLKKED